MPTMADITIKKADGTTDVVYKAKGASAGDSIPANWTLDAASTYRNLRPEAKITTRWNGPRTARRIDFSLKMPVVREIDGVDTRTDDTIMSVSVIIPQRMTDAEVSEIAAQGANLLKSTLIQSVLNSGYAPA